MDKNITKRQEDVLNYIKKYVVEHGFSPSTREIGAALGLSSPATVHTHLKKLEDAGCIRKTKCGGHFFCGGKPCIPLFRYGKTGTKFRL